MKTSVVVGITCLTLSLSISAAIAKGGEAYGSKTGKSDVEVTCRTLVNAKYCGGKQCAPGTADAQARAHMGACIQNGGKL